MKTTMKYLYGKGPTSKSAPRLKSRNPASSLQYLPSPQQVIETDSTEQLSSGRRRVTLQEIIDYTSNCKSEQSIAKKEVSKIFFQDDDEGNLEVNQLWSNYQKDDGTGSVNNIKAKLHAIATKINNLLQNDLREAVSKREDLLDKTRSLRLMQLQFAYKDERGQTQKHEQTKVLRQARRLGLYDKNNDDYNNFNSLKQAKDRAKVNMIQKLNEMFRGKLEGSTSIIDIQDIFFAKGFNTVETARNTNFKVRLSDNSLMYCGISDNGVRAMLSCERYTDKISKIYNELQEEERGVQDFKKNQKRYEKLVDIERHIGNVTCGNSRDAQEKAISLRSLNERVRPKVVLDAEEPEWGTTACLTTAYDGLGYKEVATMPDFDKAQKKAPYDKKFEHYKRLLEEKKVKQIRELWQKKGVASPKQDLQMCLYNIAHKMESAFGSNKSSLISEDKGLYTIDITRVLNPFNTHLSNDAYKNKQLLELSNVLKNCFDSIGVEDTAADIQKEIESREKDKDYIELAANRRAVQTLRGKHIRHGNSPDTQAKNERSALEKQIKTILSDKVWPGEKLDREIKELEKYKESLNGNNKDKEYDEARKQLNIPYTLLMTLRDSAIQAFQTTGPSIRRTSEHNGFIMSVMDLLHPSMTGAEQYAEKLKNRNETEYNREAGKRYENIRCSEAKYAEITDEAALAQYAIVNIGTRTVTNEGKPFTISSGKALMEPADAVLRPMQKELDIYKGLIYQLEDEYNAKVESIEKGNFTVEGIRGWFGIRGGDSEVSEGDQHLMQFTIDSLITADYKPDNLGYIKGQGQGQWQGLVTFDTNIPTASNANGKKFIEGMTQDTARMHRVVHSANHSPHDFYKAKVRLITELESAYQRFDAFKDVIGEEHAYKAMIKTLTKRMEFLKGSNPEQYLAFVEKFSETIQDKITSNTEYITELRKEVRGDTGAARETKEAISDSLKQYGDYLEQLKSLVDIGIGTSNEWEYAVKTAEETMLVDAKKYNNGIKDLVIEKVDDVKGLYVYNAIGTQGGKYYYPFTAQGSKLIAEKGREGFGFFSNEKDPFEDKAKAKKQASFITVKEADTHILRCDQELEGSDETINQALKTAIKSAQLQIEEYKSINQTLGFSDIDSFVINNAKINELQKALKGYRAECQVRKDLEEKNRLELEESKRIIELEEQRALNAQRKKVEDEYAKQLQEHQRVLKEEKRKKQEEEEKLQIAQRRKAAADMQRTKAEQIAEYKRGLRLQSAKKVENCKQLHKDQLSQLQEEIQRIQLYRRALKEAKDALFADEYQPVNDGIDDGGQRYSIKNDTRADVRHEKEKTHDEIINAMTDALQKAIKNTQKALESIEVDINAEFVRKVIHFAIENKGVRKYQEKWKAEGGRSEEEFKVARMLSYQYQQIAENSDLFTGNTSANLRLVGARLKRIPTKYIKDIVDNALDSISI